MLKPLLAPPLNCAIDLAGGLAGLLLRRGVARELIHFPFASEWLATIPFSVGWKLRRAVYARILPAMGRDAVLHRGVTLEDPRTSIGRDVWISVGCYVDYAEIGDGVLIGPHAVLLAGGRQHPFEGRDTPIKNRQTSSKERLKIGSGAWIGANATVMAEVGHDAIVGAGSVVTRAVPPFAIVAGNPARVLRMRD